MTWSTFFKSKGFKYGSLTGGVSLLAGTGVSTAMAFKMYSYCTGAATEFITQIGTHFTIDDLKAVVHYEQYNASIDLDDIYASLPGNWLQLINYADDVPQFCFAAPLVLGLSVTVVASLALANTVALIMVLRDQDKASLTILPLQAHRINDGTDEEREPLAPSS